MFVVFCTSGIDSLAFYGHGLGSRNPMGVRGQGGSAYEAHHFVVGGSSGYGVDCGTERSRTGSVLLGRLFTRPAVF
jgi:hypothetical protein